MLTATVPPGDTAFATGKPATQARLGAITRELHEALRALGATPELQRVIREIPDSRSRLSYVGEMTEKAAHRVLSLVESSMPALTAHGERAGKLADLISQASPGAEQVGVEPVALHCAEFARDSVEFASRQKQVLSDIMLTQDFQDLSGQVIKKVIDMITRTESQLVQLLIDEGHAEVPDAVPEPGLQGPQIPEAAMAQGDVDDLLASMGF